GEAKAKRGCRHSQPGYRRRKVSPLGAKLDNIGKGKNRCVEYHRADAVGQPRMVEEAGGDRAPHAHPEQDEIVGAISKGVLRGRLDVVPLTRAVVVKPAA